MGMKNVKVLNNQEKWNLVNDLIGEGKTYREIERIVHVSPNFITKVKIAEFGPNSVENNNNPKKNKLSKRTQAINLFYKRETPKEVLSELDISVDEVKKAQIDYLQLLDLNNISEIVQDNKDSNLLNDFYDLFMIFNEMGIYTIEKVQVIKELIEIYPNLEDEISCLKKENHNLKNQKKDIERVLMDTNNRISLAIAINEGLEDQIKNKKIILQNLEILEKKKSSSVYNDNIKKIIEPIVKDESWYKTTILPLMIVSVFDVIRNDLMGKFIIFDYYNYNPESIYNNKNNISSNKETDIEDTINYIYNNYLPIIMDINEYSQKLHQNLHKIYPPYLFSMILKMSRFDNLSNNQNNQKENENHKNSNNNHNQFPFNFGQKLNNTNSYIYIE